MKRISLILGDAALELVPPEIRNHPAVLNNARRRGKSPAEILLDKSIHYHAMKKLKNHEKRGRPDIVHTCLLNAHSSRLNEVGLLEVLIHTVNGEVIEINPATRIPRNYFRFTGVMEQLLVYGRVPPKGDVVLMRKLDTGLSDALREKGVSYVALLSEKGSPTTPRKLSELLMRFERPALIVGAFPHGDFSEDLYRVANESFSLGGKAYDAWYIVARMIASLEDALGIWA